MQVSRNRALLAVVDWDYSLTRWMNRSLSLTGVQPFFAFISWLGNGKFWYTLIASLPFLFGDIGLRAAAHMLVVGLVNLTIYKLAKSSTKRPRPCNASAEIFRGAAMLDEFSFPSGHTMHAVGFTVVALAWFPQISFLVLSFTLLVALSRVILGLHYPTDVLLGALLGYVIAKSSFLLVLI